MVVLLKSLSLLVPRSYYYGSNNQNQSSHKNNQCALIEKLGRCTRSDNNSVCSVTMAEVVPAPPPKCVPFLLTMMKVVVLSVVCLVGLLSLSSFGGGGSCSVEAVERGVVGHQQQYQKQWYNLNGNGNRNSGGARERHAVSRKQQINGSDGRGESRTLDQLLKRLDGGDKISESSGRRERREDNDNNRKQEGKRNPERKDADDDHQSGMIMTLPGTATAEQPHPHFQPRGPDNHQVKTSEDDEISDEEDDDDYYEYEDDENGPNLSAGTKNDRMSQWAENYKSSYLARKAKAPSEQSTTTTTTTTTTTPPPITTTEETYSQYKWKHLGTRQGLEEFRRRHVLQQNANRREGPAQFTSTSRTHHIQTNPHLHHHLYNQRNHLSNGRTSTSPPPSTTEKSETAYREDITEALQHAMKVNQEARCQVPRPRVVHIQDLYPNPSKSYVPHCTILHHCSDETGCCSRDVATCAPKTTQRVELAFYSYALDKNHEAIVERLVFYNHTECECRDKDEEMMPRDQSHFEDRRGGITSRSSVLSSTINLVKVDDRDKKKSSLCKCPSAFSRRPLPDNICVCDCFDKQMDCLHLKHGMEYFSVSDKRCIQTGRCELPECSFGPYIHLMGRCPRRNELSQGSNSWMKYLSS